MAPRDGAHERESEARPAAGIPGRVECRVPCVESRVSSFAPVERLEYALALRRGHSAPVIAYLQYHLARLAPDSDSDRRSAVASRIFEEIAHHAPQESRIAR